MPGFGFDINRERLDPRGRLRAVDTKNIPRCLLTWLGGTTHHCESLYVAIQVRPRKGKRAEPKRGFVKRMRLSGVLRGGHTHTHTHKQTHKHFNTILLAFPYNRWQLKGIKKGEIKLKTTTINLIVPV